jgi:hypothetical protein
MGYLLTKKAEATIEKTSLGVPYVKPDKETVGDIFAGLTAGTGLAVSGLLGDGLLHEKLFADGDFRRAVHKDFDKVFNKLIQKTGGDEGWLAKRLWKVVPEKGYSPTLLGKILGKGTQFGAGFKNLKWPGKLKALGLVAAPLAAGGLIDAAV